MGVRRHVLAIPGVARLRDSDLTIFSTSVLRFSTTRQELKVLPIELPLARVPVGIVTLKNRSLSPVAQLLINCAREVAKPMAKRR
jgi:DNA-binding transcriptional LysR family regulator